MKLPAILLSFAIALPLSAALLDSPQSGGLKLKSISSISFGKDGLLLVADPTSQSVIAIETKETGAKAKPGKVADIAATIAGGLGTTAENITIKDMTVNPATGTVYLAVMRRPDNGILHVSAKDKATGKENKIKIQASSGLSEEEVQRMVQDAELHAEEDKKAHELAEARNQCDGVIHMVKKSLNEYGKELSDEEKGQIESAMKAAEEAIRGNDLADIKAKSEALGAASQKLGEKVYAKQQAEASAADAAGGANAGASMAT